MIINILLLYLCVQNFKNMLKNIENYFTQLGMKILEKNSNSIDAGMTDGLRNFYVKVAVSQGEQEGFFHLAIEKTLERIDTKQKMQATITLSNVHENNMFYLNPRAIKLIC